MTERPPNHARNLLVILVLSVGAYVAWNAIGAAQCMQRDGTLSRDGATLRCTINYNAG